MRIGLVTMGEDSRPFPRPLLPSLCGTPAARSSFSHVPSAPALKFWPFPNRMERRRNPCTAKVIFRT